MVKRKANKQPKMDYDKFWDDLGEEFKRYGPSSRHTRRMIMKYMKDVKFKSIIDIGCGTGIFIESLNLKGKKVTGVDISTTGLKICKRRMPRGNFKTLDIEKQFIKKTFDLGICSEVLEHIKNDVKALKNLRKMCKYLIISVPAGKYGKDDKIMGHYRRYSKEDIAEKLNKAGFSVVKCERWGFPFYSPIFRFIVNNTSEKRRTGKITLFKRIASEFFYILFFIGIKNKGDRLFVLVK